MTVLVLLLHSVPVLIVGEVALHYEVSRLLGRHGLGALLDRGFARLLRRPRRMW